MNTTITNIIEKEWNMFHNVNGEQRASCQEDYNTFVGMRSAQFKVWSQAALESYLEDLNEAETNGWNMVREKYIRMMKSTDPSGYEHFKDNLPQVSEKKAALVAEIWSHMLTQTKRMRVHFPILAMGGRCLHASEERTGDTSIETYQASELLTYSEKTLEAFLAQLIALEEQGIDMVYQIQENSVTCLGYSSMEEAEHALAQQMVEAMAVTQKGNGCRYCADWPV